MSTDAAQQQAKPRRGKRQPNRPQGDLRVVTSLSAFPQPLAEWKRLAEAEGISFSQFACRAMEQYARTQAG